MGKLKGKVALVTGAGRNLGRAIALEYAREGADLALVTSSRRRDLEATGEECRREGVRVWCGVGDLSDPAQVRSLVEQSLSALGRIDILVSTVGDRTSKPLLDMDVDEWHHLTAINFHSTFYLARAVLSGMVERRSGAIIAVGVIASPPHKSNLSLHKTHMFAGKAGVLGLIQGIAIEFGSYGIRANAIEPGGIEVVRDHPEWYPGVSGPPEKAVAPLAALERPGKPHEVARVAVFLASEDSSYVTGACIPCNGGLIIR